MPLEVLIAGGGIGGIAAALRLAEEGHNVELFEQAPSFSEAGAGIQLSPNCTSVLHHLGLESALQEKAFLPEGTQIRDWKSGKLISESALGDTAVRQFGFPYYHIHRGDLLALMVDAASGISNIRLHTDSRIESFTEQEGTVKILINGEASKGDLLIGADGIHSTIRASLWGEEKPNFTGNIAWRALVPSAKLPEGLIRPVSTVWWGPGKHFVHYFVRRGEMVNCVCVVEKTGWEVESWTERGDYEELKSDFHGWHPDIQTLIDSADRDSLYKWALYDRPPMKTWGKGRVTLLGDACHPTLPFMAQGAAMAIEDGAVLAACLKHRADVPTALQQYEDLRRERTARIQKGSRRNATIFHMSGIKAWARNLVARKATSSAMDGLYGYNALEATSFLE
ncbi:MAG: FAD-dependent monooxygenase [Pseudomonadales bacterium]|jgi:salicylate hydroxylase|nr:FAD-dependent monooxygenase [Pseudomonadales bacterium]